MSWNNPWMVQKGDETCSDLKWWVEFELVEWKLEEEKEKNGENNLSRENSINKAQEIFVVQIPSERATHIPNPALVRRCHSCWKAVIFSTGWGQGPCLVHLSISRTRIQWLASVILDKYLLNKWIELLVE